MKSIAEVLHDLTDRRTAYKLTLGGIGPAQRAVLADLSFFCRANESCVVPGDSDKTLVLEGRREVWLRIQQHLNLTTEQLFQLYGGQRSPTKGNEQ